MNENIKNTPSCDEAYNNDRTELEKEALSIIPALSDEELSKIMEVER